MAEIGRLTALNGRTELYLAEGLTIDSVHVVETHYGINVIVAARRPRISFHVLQPLKHVDGDERWIVEAHRS